MRCRCSKYIINIYCYSVIILSLLFNILLVNSVVASQNNIVLNKAPIDISDKASLQRGSKYFMNFCASCHSAEFMRYSRMAKDLNMVDSEGEILVDLIKANLMFNSSDINSHIKSGLNKIDGAKMFGVAPPDLTMVTRVRGNDWVYTYLKSFYSDSNRPWGVNNTVFKDVAMPNVFQNCQGTQQLIDKKLVKTSDGYCSDQEFDELVSDITNFLAYTAEPYKSDRLNLGVWVLLFLAIFFVFAYLLKKEYWKDIKK